MGISMQGLVLVRCEDGPRVDMLLLRSCVFMIPLNSFLQPCRNWSEMHKFVHNTTVGLPQFEEGVELWELTNQEARKIVGLDWPKMQVVEKHSAFLATSSSLFSPD